MDGMTRSKKEGNGGGEVEMNNQLTNHASRSGSSAQAKEIGDWGWRWKDDSQS